MRRVNCTLTLFKRADCVITNDAIRASAETRPKPLRWFDLNNFFTSPENQRRIMKAITIEKIDGQPGQVYYPFVSTESPIRCFSYI